MYVGKVLLSSPSHHIEYMLKCLVLDMDPPEDEYKSITTPPVELHITLLECMGILSRLYLTFSPTPKRLFASWASQNHYSFGAESGRKLE